MKKNYFGNLLSWLFAVILVLTIGSIALKATGYFPDTRSVTWLSWYKFIPFLLSVLLFIVLIVKAFVSTKSRWTRWSCVAIGILFLFGFNVGVLAIKSLNELEDYLIFFLVNLLILPLFLLPLIIRKSKWTRWLFASEMFVFFIMASIVLIINIKSFSDVKLQSRILYRNIENSNKYVAVFENPKDPDDSREFYVVRRFGLLKKSSFKKSMLSGVWSKYDEDGNVIAEYTFDEGDVLYKNFPQNAIKIKNNADFAEMAKNPGDESLYVVLDDVLLDKEILIKDKPAISIEGFGKNDSKASLYSDYDTPVRIIFEGCDHIKLKNLHFSFNSEHKQPFILSFKNCNRVEIVDCSFYGDARYSLSFDANCDEIHLEDNRIDGFSEYGVVIHDGDNKHYFAEDNFYEYNYTRYIKSRRIWIEGFEQVNFDDFELNEAWVRHDSWYFDDNNYSSANFSGHALGAFVGDCLYLPDALGFEDHFNDRYFSLVGGDDLNNITNMLALLTGINPVVSPAYQSSELKFTHINPEFVQWGKERITENVISQEFYNYVLKPFSRLFCESYLYLQNEDNTENLVQRYYEKAESGYASNFLSERFNGVLPYYDPNYDEYGKEYGEEESYYGMTRQASMMGFWIRRMIDGSHESIWEAARKFMEFYDDEWLNETIQQYSIEEFDSYLPGDSVIVPEDEENSIL